jgi:hypothetical protein
VNKGLLLIVGVVLLIRLPFLNQAVQGDDHIYLKEASHALVDPWHPSDVRDVFLGDVVDLRGHSHPPLNAWVLAGLLAVFGDVREVPFHAAYILFSLIAVLAMWGLARRFSPHPVGAVLLLAAVPAFVVNGGSLESDLPLLAFWLAAVALFCAGRLGWAAAAMALATMAAYQAVLLTPILAVWVWQHRRRDWAAWLTVLTPAVTVVAWQVFMRQTTGAMPAAVLSGYFTHYGFQALQKKLASTLMLGIHSWFLVFPLLIPPAAMLAWRKRRDPDTQFLLAWIGIFFAGAAVIFFAGSARYLLPMAAPVAILASRLRVRWVALGFAAQLALGLGLAAENYEHWEATRQFALSLRAETAGRRVWVDDDLGLRYYMEAAGAVPLTRGQTVKPGSIVVWSEMARSVPVTAPHVTVARAEVRPGVPLRLIGIESRSGYSDVSRGFWPFGISTGVVDRLEAVRIVERHAELSYLPMNAPEAKEQIVSGLFGLENDSFRWMSGRAVLALKSPAAPGPVSVAFTIPENAPGRRVTILVDGREVCAETYAGPGTYTQKCAARPAGAVAMVEIRVDKTFSAPGDQRELGAVVTGVGFLP